MNNPPSSLTHLSPFPVGDSLSVQHTNCEMEDIEEREGELDWLRIFNSDKAPEHVSSTDTCRKEKKDNEMSADLCPAAR